MINKTLMLLSCAGNAFSARGVGIPFGNASMYLMILNRSEQRGLRSLLNHMKPPSQPFPSFTSSCDLIYNVYGVCWACVFWAIRTERPIIYENVVVTLYIVYGWMRGGICLVFSYMVVRYGPCSVVPQCV